MVPTPDFSAEQGLELRRALVPRMERIERSRPHTLRTIYDAVVCEVREAQADPLHHAMLGRGGSTSFVRYLNAYAKRVEQNRNRLVDDVDDEVFYAFAHHVVGPALDLAARRARDSDPGSDSDSDSGYDDAPISIALMGACSDDAAAPLPAAAHASTNETLRRCEETRTRPRMHAPPHTADQAATTRRA